MPADKLTFAFDAFKGVQPLSTEEKRQFSAAEEKARAMIGEATVNVLQKAVDEVMQSLAVLLEKTPGIGYWVDKEIGSDEVVFAVLGPHTGNYGDAQVVLVFNPSVLWHPDTFLTPLAAIAYHQGFYCSQSNLLLDRRLWMGDAKPWTMGGKEAYEEAQFHHTADGWSVACAMEWIARTALRLNKDGANVTLKDVQEIVRVSDSHTAIEAHLPGLVPLALVDKVIMTREARNRLPDGVYGALCAIFEERKHSGAANTNFVEVVGDTRARLFELMTSRERGLAPPPHWQQPSGFCFVVRLGGSEHVCPMVLPPPSATTKTVVRFVAVSKSGDLCVTLKDSRGGAPPVTFVLDCYGGKAIAGLPAAAATAGVLDEDPTFNLGVQRPVEHLKLVLQLNRDGTMYATLKHFGATATFNSAQLVAPLSASLQARWIVTFSASLSPAIIWNVTCECAPASQDTKCSEHRLSPSRRAPVPPSANTTMPCNVAKLPEARPQTSTFLTQSTVIAAPTPFVTAPVVAQPPLPPAPTASRLNPTAPSIAPPIDDQEKARCREEEEA